MSTYRLDRAELLNAWLDLGAVITDTVTGDGTGTWDVVQLGNHTTDIPRPDNTTIVAERVAKEALELLVRLTGNPYPHLGPTSAREAAYAAVLANR